jgi:hypothetical protein
MISHTLATITTSKFPTHGGLRGLSSTPHPAPRGEEEEELKQKNKPNSRITQIPYPNSTNRQSLLLAQSHKPASERPF